MAPNFQVHQIQLFDTAEGYGGGTSEERLRDVANVANASGGDEKRQRWKVAMVWGALGCWESEKTPEKLRGNLEKSWGLEDFWIWQDLFGFHVESNGNSLWRHTGI